MKTHTGETTCDLCNRVFFSANNLKKHKEKLSCLRGDPQQRTKIEIKEVRFYYKPCFDLLLYGKGQYPPSKIPLLRSTTL